MKMHVKIKQEPFERAIARLNLSYQDLAKELGVNRIYLSNIKNEGLPQFRPSGNLRQKILDVLDVEFDEVFEVVSNKKKKRKKVSKRKVTPKKK